MKILIISQYAGSPELGMVLRNYNWGIEFIKQRHDVTVVAASYSHYRNNNPDIGRHRSQSEKIDGVQFKWLKTSPYNGDSNLGRIRAMMEFQFRLVKELKSLKAENYDIVVASSPHPFVIYPAHRLARKVDAKLIYDIRDLWPLTLRKIGGMSKWHPFIMALQHAECYALKNADLVTASQQNSNHYLVSRGMAPDKFLHIGNGYLERDDHISLQNSHLSVLQKLKENGAFIIGYCGTLGKANAMHSAVEAIAQTDNKSIHLVTVGNGYYREDLKALARKFNIVNNVHFLDPIPHNQVRSFLNYIDVAYITALNSTLYKYGISPAKVNDYMAASKPILYGMGDPNNPVELSGGGLICSPEDVADIANAMDIFSQMNAVELKDMGQKGCDWLYRNQLISIHINRILNKLFG